MFYRYGAMEFVQCFLEPLFITVGFINATTYSLQVCQLHGLLSMTKNIKKRSY